MKLSKYIFGTEQPSLERIRFYVIFLLLTFIATIGAYADFAPTQFWARIALYAAVTTSPIFGWITWRYVYFDPELKLKQINPAKKAAASIALVALLLFEVWSSTLAGVPTLLTYFRNPNVEASEPFELKVRSRSSLKVTCRYLVHTATFRYGFWGAMCVNKEEAMRLADTREIKFMATSTPMGVYVHTFGQSDR